MIEGGPAWKAGLSAKDEIIALDGLKLNPDEFDKRLDEAGPGESLRFSLFRSGSLREISVRLGRQDNVTWTLRKLKSATPAQKRLREGWLWGKG